MLRKLSFALSTTVLSLVSIAQDSTKTEEKPKPTITGSVDAYWRYNFQNAKDQGVTNNMTSFTNSHNSFELGMASVKIDHSFGKVGGVLDLGFGRRAEEFSYNDVTVAIDDNGDDVKSPTLLAAVKQAFVTYAPSDKVKFTMGKFGTHVGYELLDAPLNRNYSMSYMFSYGPFFHTGLKMDVAATDNFSFMLGIANPTDLSTASFENKFFLGQVHGATNDGSFGGYLNYVGGKNVAKITSSQLDLVLTGKISDKFSIGYNGTTRSLKYPNSPGQSFWGSALYLNVDPTANLGLCLRGEYFDDKKNGTDGYIGTSVFATTLSANIKVDGLTIIPEFRIDSGKNNLFTKNDGTFTKSAGAFVLAAVYAF